MKYTPGQKGTAHITLTKKNFKGGVTANGTIIDVDEKFILFKDNDDIEYIVPKSKFTFTEDVNK